MSILLVLPTAAANADSAAFAEAQALAAALAAAEAAALAEALLADIQRPDSEVLVTADAQSLNATASATDAATLGESAIAATQTAGATDSDAFSLADSASATLEASDQDAATVSEIAAGPPAPPAPEVPLLAGGLGQREGTKHGHSIHIRVRKEFDRFQLSDEAEVVLTPVPQPWEPQPDDAEEAFALVGALTYYG